MKATGIVRRVDDLGRIVIPKEIRRTLRIREGDSPRITTSLWIAERWGWSAAPKSSALCIKRFQ